MPSAISPNPRAGSLQQDELDRLLDDDNAIEEFFQDLPRNSENANTAAQEQGRDEDQEVQVKKKRAPIPKLDENRLLSDAGIPRLRKITKSRLKFRGKGHEFTDISNLLNTYQLWLDDLYPRAKFRDAVKMVEKVGHSKRMQVTRRAWLDDTKPSRKELTPSPDAQISSTADDERIAGTEPRPDDTSSNLAVNSQIMGSLDAAADDELDALMAEGANNAANTKGPATSRKTGPFDDDEPDEDELDALLAGSGAPGIVPARHPVKQKSTMPFDEEPDDDELDAIMAEQPYGQPIGNKDTSTTKQQNNDEFADDEEAMRDMW